MFWAIGSNIEQFEKMVAEYIGTKYAVAFNSGTSPCMQYFWLMG